MVRYFDTLRFRESCLPVGKERIKKYRNAESVTKAYFFAMLLANHCHGFCFFMSIYILLPLKDDRKL